MDNSLHVMCLVSELICIFIACAYDTSKQVPIQLLFDLQVALALHTFCVLFGWWMIYRIVCLPEHYESLNILQIFQEFFLGMKVYI